MLLLKWLFFLWIFLTLKEIRKSSYLTPKLQEDISKEMVAQATMRMIIVDLTDRMAITRENIMEVHMITIQEEVTLTWE